MRKFLFIILLPLLSIGGLFLYAGGPKLFELSGTPPPMEIRLPSGLQAMAPPDDQLWKAYRSRNPRRAQVICQIGYQERVPFRLASRLPGAFVWEAKGPLAGRLGRSYESQGIEMGDEISETEIGGVPAIAYSYRRAAQGSRELPVRGRGAYLIHDSYGIQMSCYGPADGFATTERAFGAFTAGMTFPDLSSPSS